MPGQIVITRENQPIYGFDKPIGTILNADTMGVIGSVNGGVTAPEDPYRGRTAGQQLPYGYEQLNSIPEVRAWNDRMLNDPNFAQEVLNWERAHPGQRHPQAPDLSRYGLSNTGLANPVNPATPPAGTPPTGTPPTGTPPTGTPPTGVPPTTTNPNPGTGTNPITRTNPNNPSNPTIPGNPGGPTTPAGTGPTTTNTGFVNPQLQALFNLILQNAQGRAAELGGANAPQLPGVVPNANADQLAGQDAFRTYAGNFNTQIFNPAVGARDQLIANGTNIFANPAVQAAMEANARQINQAASDPGGLWSQIRTGAGQNGQFGSSRQGIAEGIAAGRVSNAIGDANTGILNNAFNTGQQGMQYALGQTGALAAAGATPGSLLSAVGQQNYDITQNQNLDNRAQFLYGQAQKDKALQMLMSVFQSGLPTGQGTQTNVDYPDWYKELMTQQGGSGSTGLGGLLGILGILGALGGGTAATTR